MVQLEQGRPPVTGDDPRPASNPAKSRSPSRRRLRAESCPSPRRRKKAWTIPGPGERPGLTRILAREFCPGSWPGILARDLGILGPVSDSRPVEGSGPVMILGPLPLAESCYTIQLQVIRNCKKSDG